MSQTGTINTPMDRKVEVRQYGINRYQRSKNGEDQYAPEYNFDALQYIIDEIEKARKENWDRTILFTGDEGCGKSTLAGWVATELGLSDEQRVTYSPNDFLKELRDAGTSDVVWLDEGARGLYSRDAMTKTNKTLTKAFTQIRIKELVSIICLPHKDLLDKNIKNRRIHYWCDVKSQGYDRGYSKWRIAGKPNRRPDELKVPKHANEWNIDVYWEPLFSLRFPKLKENNGFDWDAYEEHKVEELDAYLDEAGKEDTPAKVVPNLAAATQFLKDEVEKVVLKDGSVRKTNVKEIAKAVGLSDQSIYRYLKKKTPEDWEYA